MRPSHAAPRLLVLGAALLLGGPACGDDPAAPDAVSVAALSAAGTITGASLGAVVRDLAHDSLRGRDTHTPELDGAAAYLADAFRNAGLAPAGTQGYYQPFPFTAPVLAPDEAVLELDGDAVLTYGEDFALFASAQEDVTGPLVWGGRLGGSGLALGVPVSGAIVLLDHPGTQVDRAWRGMALDALQQLAALGAAGLALVLPDGMGRDTVAARAELLARSRVSRPVAVLTGSAARTLTAAAGHSLDQLRAGIPRALPANLRVRGSLDRTVTHPANVAALLEGSDPSLKDEYILVTAHYDHVGVGFADANGDSIYNGADDNASGTAGVLEAARSLASLDERPRRSVLFLALAGEEDGLLGSIHFIQAPTVPRDGLVAAINLDMIGRNAPGRVVGIGMSYTSMGDQVRAIVDRADLGLTVYNDESAYAGSSDHAPFVWAGIPALFLHTGLHEDYHQPSDEADALNSDKAARIARLATLLAYQVADTPERVTWTDRAYEHLYWLER